MTNSCLFGSPCQSHKHFKLFPSFCPSGVLLAVLLLLLCLTQHRGVKSDHKWSLGMHVETLKARPDHGAHPQRPVSGSIFFFFFCWNNLFNGTDETGHRWSLRISTDRQSTFTLWEEEGWRDGSIWTSSTSGSTESPTSSSGGIHSTSKASGMHSHTQLFRGQLCIWFTPDIDK